MESESAHVPLESGRSRARYVCALCAHDLNSVQSVSPRSPRLVRRIRAARHVLRAWVPGVLFQRQDTGQAARPGRLTVRVHHVSRSDSRPLAAPAPDLQVLQLIVNYQDYQIDELGRELDDRDAAEVSAVAKRRMRRSCETVGSPEPVRARGDVAPCFPSPTGPRHGPLQSIRVVSHIISPRGGRIV